LFALFCFLLLPRTCGQHWSETIFHQVSFAKLLPAWFTISWTLPQGCSPLWSLPMDRNKFLSSSSSKLQVLSLHPSRHQSKSWNLLRVTNAVRENLLYSQGFHFFPFNFAWMFLFLFIILINWFSFLRKKVIFYLSLSFVFNGKFCPFNLVHPHWKMGIPLNSFGVRGVTCHGISLWRWKYLIHISKILNIVNHQRNEK
jgi:hypothetical protein